MPKHWSDDHKSAKDVYSQAVSVYEDGDYLQARQLFEESLRLFADIEDKSGIGHACHGLGIIAHDNGDLEDAKKYYEKSKQIFEEIGDSEGLCANLNRMAMMARDVDDCAEAFRLYKECLKIKEDADDKPAMLCVLHQLGTLAHALGSIDEAFEMYKKQFEVAEKLEEWEYVAVAVAQIYVFLIEKRKRFEGLMLLVIAHEMFLRLEDDRFVQTSREIDKFKDQGYEGQIVSLLDEYSSASYEKIMSAIHDTLSNV